MNIFLNVSAAQRVCGSSEVVHTGEEDSQGTLITHSPFCHPRRLFPTSSLAPIIYLSTSALNYRQWSGGQGAGPGDLGSVWLMNNGVRPPSCLFPAFTQSRGPERNGGTSLLNNNQRFVVLIRLACSHFTAVPHKDGKTGGGDKGRRAIYGRGDRMAV